MSQATQETREEATQAAQKLKEMIKQLEESMADKQESRKWEEVDQLLKGLQEQNQRLFNNCADADKKIQELEKENSNLRKKVKGLESKVLEMEVKARAPTFDLGIEGQKLTNLFFSFVYFSALTY